MIRFILVCIVVIGYLILSIPILLVEWIIGKFSPMKKDISSLRIIQAVFRFILWITGAKVTVIGEENVPKDIYINVMAQYFPTYKAKEDELINRKLTKREYRQIEEYFYSLDFKNGYMQELGEHEEEYVPKWDN